MDKDKEVKNENNEINLENENDFQDVVASSATRLEDGNVSSADAEEFDDITFVESTEDGEAMPVKDVAKKLREEVKKLQKERDEYLTGWQRAKADYINLQKELDQARITTSLATKERIVGEILPALDSFDMAFANKEAWEKVDSNWRMGVEYIYSQLMRGLEDAGIEKIDKVGVTFDPNLHHSMEAVVTDDKSKDHTVEKIIQIGYKIGERIIRPAKVNIYEYKN